MSFSVKPTTASDWVAGAPVGAGKVANQSPSSRPWEVLDPRAPASKAFNLRLNEYELALLRAVAEAEFSSQQGVAKRILVRALEDAARELK